MRLPLTATELVSPSFAAPPPAMPAMRPIMPSSLTCVFSVVFTSACSAGAKNAAATTPAHNIFRDMFSPPSHEIRRLFYGSGGRMKKNVMAVAVALLLTFVGGLGAEMSQRRSITAGPAPIGPYSPAIVAGGLVYVSGMLGTGADGQLVGPDVASQTRRILD